MFCPKCGNQLPDGASFCNACGAKLADRTQATPAAQPAASAGAPMTPAVSTKNPAKGLRIATIIVAICAVISGLLPWFESSNMLMGLGSFGSSMGQLGSALSGKNYNIASFADEYSPIGFFGLGSAMNQYSSSMPGGIIIFAFFMWLIGMALLIAGLIVMLAGKKKSKILLIVGSIVFAVVALLWMLIYGMLVSGGYAVGTATNAMSCAVFCIATAVLAIILRAKEA